MQLGDGLWATNGGLGPFRLDFDDPVTGSGLLQVRVPFSMRKPSRAKGTMEPSACSMASK